MKSKIKIFLIIAVYLTICYAIGQYRYSKQEVIDSHPDNNEVAQSEWGDYSYDIEGSSKTEDNPWGYTAGVISTDEWGECILLTPNTAFSFNNLKESTSISLQMQIHPWVAASSDGAGIDVWFLNDANEIVHEDSYEVKGSTDWVDINYNLWDYPGATKIKFSCNNGNENNDEADWVVFRINNNFAE